MRAVRGMEGPRAGPGARGDEGACHLVFLPDRAAPRFLVWGAGAGAVASPLAACGKPEKASLMDETLAPRALAGVAVPLLDALPLLAAMTAAETDRAPASVAVWSLAAPRACLADDMGLGKTIQLLAFLLHRRAACPEDRRRALLVCPTSVVGHWEREVTRFAPSLPVVRHYGPDRARSAAALESAPPGAMVVTTYGLLRRDAEILADRWWNPAVEDQATDRAYRIGQRRAVQVHKLLTAGTVVRRALYWLPED